MEHLANNRERASSLDADITLDLAFNGRLGIACYPERLAKFDRELPLNSIEGIINDPRVEKYKHIDEDTMDFILLHPLKHAYGKRARDAIYKTISWIAQVNNESIPTYYDTLDKIRKDSDAIRYSHRIMQAIRRDIDALERIA